MTNKTLVALATSALLPLTSFAADEIVLNKASAKITGSYGTTTLTVDLDVELQNHTNQWRTEYNRNHKIYLDYTNDMGTEGSILIAEFPNANDARDEGTVNVTYSTSSVFFEYNGYGINSFNFRYVNTFVANESGHTAGMVRTYKDDNFGNDYEFLSRIDGYGTDLTRTTVFMYGQTVVGQDMYIRGGIDFQQAHDKLNRNCWEDATECMIPMVHRNVLTVDDNNRSADAYLDWHGGENGQDAGIEGSPLAWTTDYWPESWGTKREVLVDGYGETSLNKWGQHYWMLDVYMDCSKAFTDVNTGKKWFELKSYISNGPGWEGNIAQAGAPYASHNHFAQCGKINKFISGNSSAEILDY